MPRICHLFDMATGWEQRVAVSQLVDRLPRQGHAQTLAAIDPTALAPLRALAMPIRVFPRVAGITALAAPLIGRFLDRTGFDLVHAWGPDAAAAATIASRRPLVIELFDPAIAKKSVKLLRTLSRPTHFAIISSCEWIRRRLIEGGVSPDLCVTVRPGIDFAFINQARRAGLRDQLSIQPGQFVILLPEPVTRDGGHLEAFWAGALLNHFSRGFTVIVPGRSREQNRIARFAATAPSRPSIVTPGADVPFERLIPIADALVAASGEDVSTTAIAWALASHVAVIAAAGYATAELVANKVNGLLYKRTRDRGSVVSLVRLLEDRDTQARMKEAAHGQAFEVFGLRRYVEQHMRVYENVIAGLAPGTGIVDSAQVG